MRELYEYDSATEMFELEVQEACRCSQEVREYKAVHPMYALLQNRNGFGVVHGDFSRALKLGLVDDNGQITQDGLDWLSAPLEL